MRYGLPGCPARPLRRDILTKKLSKVVKHEGVNESQHPCHYIPTAPSLCFSAALLKSPTTPPRPYLRLSSPAKAESHTLPVELPVRSAHGACVRCTCQGLAYASRRRRTRSAATRLSSARSMRRRGVLNVPFPGGSKSSGGRRKRWVWGSRRGSWFPCLYKRGAWSARRRRSCRRRRRVILGVASSSRRR